MGRNLVRTTTLSLDHIAQLNALFGTPKNIQRVLGLEDMPYAIFYRAISHLTVKPEERELIEGRWLLWRKTFLRDEHQRTSDFELTPELLEEVGDA